MPQNRLTPAQLMDLKNDPRMEDPLTRAKVMSQLAPEDAGIFRNQPVNPRGGGPKPNGMFTDLATGVLKGAGSTATNLGSLVGSIPGVGAVTNALGNAIGGNWSSPDTGKVSNDEAFGQIKKDLQPSNTTQQVGKTGEQMGEFFIPGGAAENAAQDLLYKIPPSVWDTLPANAMYYLRNMLGGAGAAYGTASAQGDEEPWKAALAGGAAAPLAEGARALVPGAAAAAPFVAGGAAMHAAAPGMGLVGGLGLGSLLRNVVRREVTTPENINALQSLIRRAAPKGGQLVGGAISQAQKHD